MEIPELVGLGQVSDEDSKKHGTAMLDAFACALEVCLPYTLPPFNPLTAHFFIQMFDLLDVTPSSTHILRQILHVAAYPPDNTRHPAWNVNPDFDHLSWSCLPQELRKVRTVYSHVAQSPFA